MLAEQYAETSSATRKHAESADPMRPTTQDSRRERPSAATISFARATCLAYRPLRARNGHTGRQRRRDRPCRSPRSRRSNEPDDDRRRHQRRCMEATMWAHLCATLSRYTAMYFTEAARNDDHGAQTECCETSHRCMTGRYAPRREAHRQTVRTCKRPVNESAMRHSGGIQQGTE